MLCCAQVFDVYKPGSAKIVSRNNQTYPEVACHLAVCNTRPPTLSELRFADQQALSSQVPVKWASVLAGTVSLYEIGESDIIKLV